MINFLIDNIYIEIGGRIFQQTVGTNCAPLLVDLVLHSYEPPPFLRAVTCSWWGIAYLSDPYGYAGWSFCTPDWASPVRQVEGWRSDKVAAQSLSLYFSTFLPFTFLLFYSLFLLLLCFSRPYITFLRWLDVKPLSLTHSYETKFVQEVLRKGEKKLAQSYNYTFRYIDDV